MTVRTDIMGVTFDDLTLAEAVAAGEDLAKGPGFSYVVTPNPEIVNLARADESYRVPVKDDGSSPDLEEGEEHVPSDD